MAKKQWSMRPYREGDEVRIHELFRLVFGKELSAERWNWLYRDNHTGVIAITLAEGENGELAGQSALRPVRMKIGGKTHLGTQSMDSMVHPDYRKQGMFTTLTTHTYEAVAEQGVALVYGFPNQNSQWVYTHRLGRVDLCDRLPVFLKILDVKKVLGKRIRNELLLSLGTLLGGAALKLVYALGKRATLPTDCQVERVSRFDDCVSELWEKASDAYAILVVRDKEYLNWRYVDNPTEEYVIFVVRKHHEAIGYIVLKCEERFGLRIGFIVDMLTVPDEPNVGVGLIAMAVEFFRKQHSDIVSCLMLEHVPYARFLRNNGFVILPEKLFPQELHLNVRRFSDEYSDQFITDPTNWFVTWGDHDVV